MIKDFKFRTNADITIQHPRRRRGSRWLAPLLVCVAGGIYAALQFETKDDTPPSSDSGQILTLPLALPGEDGIEAIPAPSSPLTLRPLQLPASVEPAGETVPAGTSKDAEQVAASEIAPEPVERVATVQVTSEPVEQVATAEDTPESVERVATLDVAPEQVEQAATVEVASEQAEQVATAEVAPEQVERAATVEDTPEQVEQVLAAEASFALEEELEPSQQSSRWLTHEIKSGDSLARIFNELGLSSSLLHQIVNCHKLAGRLNSIRPGQILQIELDEDGVFAQLNYEIDPVRTLHIARESEGLQASLLERELEQRSAEASGVIESSLFLGAQRAGLSDTLTMKLAEIFGWDIDFALEIRSGDRFSVVYEEQWLDGEKLKDGRIMAAEFVNQGKIYRAVRFKGPDGREDYYTPDGQRMRKTFLRTPVKFSRISSGFTKRRWHPVLKKWRSHKGVDYAAPRGTPVKSAGDGKVTFVGRKGGYGKVIFIQHEGIYTTVYGHLNGFAKGLRKGRRIKQGQLIGYVGSTGLASGPHLHYEFRVNGKHRNPLKVTFAPAAPLPKKYIPAFQKATQPLLTRLDNLNNTLVADAL
jgi:murein DD-endopeptidase MepM/ murein hydrolase activator NlpD